MFQRNGDEPFYERKNAYRNNGIVSLAGCGLMVAATFFYWKHLIVRTIEKSYTGVSFFSSALSAFRSMSLRDFEGNVIGHNYSFSNIWTVFLLLLFYVAVACLGFAGFKDNIARAQFFNKWGKRIRIGVLLLTVIIVILLCHTAYYKSGVAGLVELKVSWDSFIEMCDINHIEGAHRMRCYYSAGPGFFVYVIGAAAYLFSVIYKFVLDTLNEDD